MTTTNCKLPGTLRILSLLFAPFILITQPQVLLGQCLSPPSGIIAWWPGDGSATDVASANRATLMYGASFASGRVGQAFSFDGGGGYVELPDNVLPYTPLAPTNSPFTFETWFLTSTGGVILGQQSTPVFANPDAGYSANPDNGYMPVLYVGTDGLLRCEAFWSGNATNQLHTAAPVNDGVFHHCAVTFDGATEVLYIDGQEGSSRPYQQVPYWTNYWYQLGIGNFGTHPASARPAAPLGWFPFTGLIDEATFYNRALSGSEVGAIFSAGSAGKCKSSVVGVTRMSAGNGEWNTAATWNPPGVPGVADDVIIRAGDVITVSATPASPVNSITFDNTSAFNHILKVNSPATLTVTTSLTLQSANGNNTAALLAGSGVINCGSAAIGGTGVPSGGATTTATLTSTVSTLSISGNLAINGGLSSSGDSRNSSYFALNSGSVSIGGSVAFGIGPGSPSSNSTTYGVLDMTGLPGTGVLTFLGGNPVTASGGSIGSFGIGLTPAFLFYPGTTVLYSGAAQTIFPASYRSLVIGGSGIKAMGGVSVGNLTLTGTATVAANGGVGVGGDLIIGLGATFDMTTASSLSVGGNWFNSGTFIPGASSSVSLNGTSGPFSAAQTITGRTTFNNLSLSGGVALASDVTVDGTLSLGCVPLTTGTNQFTFGPSALVSSSCPLIIDGCPSYIIGNVEKVFSPGAAQAFTFAIGDSSGCGVLSLSSMDVIATGVLRVSTTAGDQLSVSSSGIDSAKSVNRYWTLVQSGGSFGSYNATFNYQAASVDANADPSQFIVQQLPDSGAWSPATVLGTPTTTATTIIGQTGFGSFAIGDRKQDQTITFPSPGDQTYGVRPINLSATASSGLTVSYAVSGPATVTGNVLTITGAGSVQITATQAGNASWNAATPVVQTISVGVAELTVSGITANNKIYDGNTMATLNTNSPGLVGLVGSDTVTLNTSGAVGAFIDKNVGNGKAVSVSGLTIGGASAGNYALMQPTTTANITAKALTVSGVTAKDKTYDGTTTVTLDLSGALLGGVVPGDIVTLNAGSATGTFADKNVGNGKTVNVTGLTISGADAGNYALAQPTTTASITPASVVPSITVSDKVYEATTVATIATRTLTGAINSDPVSLSGGTASFADKNVGTGKAVTATDLILTGSAAGNYTLQPTTASTTANITARALLVSATGVNKVYDGTTAATVTLSDNRVAGDVLTVTYASAVFQDKNVGNGKAVALSGISISGADAANYTFNTTASTTANITPRPITVTAATDNKVYDGTTNSTNLPTLTAGTLTNGDSATWTQTFDNKNVGTGKTLTPAGTVSDGNNGNNYSITFVQKVTGIITARNLLVTATGVDKVYDGTTAETVNLVDNKLTGDVLTDTYTSATFDARNVGAGKAVSVSGISISGPDATNYLANTTASTTASITVRPITVTAVADTKVYDGTISSVGVPKITTGSLASLDSAIWTQTFDTKNVGTAKTLTPAGVVNDGNGGNNYSGTFVPSSAGAITALGIVGSVAVADKTYDGTISATITNYALSGVLTGDTVNYASGTATFADKNVGSNKTVTVTGLSLSGTDAGNYTVNTAYSTFANIFARAITVTAVSDTKIYDGTTNSAGAPTITAGSLASGDSPVWTQAFNNKTVGMAKILTPVGSVSDGNGGNNYSVTFATLNSGDITPRALAVTATGVDKVYDGTTVATVTLSNNHLPGDVVTANYGSANFDTKNVGNAKSVSVTGISITGADAGNYTANTTALAKVNITPKALTVSGVTADDKIYDGNTAVTIIFSNPVLVGVVAGDSVTLNTNSAVGAFADKNVGNAKPVSVTGLSISGADAGNYTLTRPATTASITPATLTVKPDDKSRVYSAPNPPLAASYTNFVGGDGTNVLSGASALSTTALVASPVGAYPITVTAGSLSASNYTFVFTNGTLTISQASSLNTLTSSQNPSPLHSNVTFAASLTPIGPATFTPTGTVRFFTNGVAAGASVILTNGLATFNTALLPPGSNTVTAQYAGDSNFLGSTTNFVQVVSTNTNQAPITLAIRNNGDGTVTVSFVAIPGTGYLLQTSTNVGVAASWTTASTNTAAANGQVTFTDSITRQPHQFYRSAQP